jgi:hypothetical protein
MFLLNEARRSEARELESCENDDHDLPIIQAPSTPPEGLKYEASNHNRQKD